LKGFSDSLWSPQRATEVNHGCEGDFGKEICCEAGKSPAQRLLKARILLKADVSESGEGWSDSRIIKALETSASTIYRVRKQLLEEGIEAVLSRKQRATPAVARIFDGEKEAKLIALACSKPPKGRAR
jgi:Homeodomain-like domain